MKKIIVSMLIMGCLLTTSVTSLNASCTKIQKTIEVSKIDPYSKTMLYKYSVNQKVGSMCKQCKTTSNNDPNPEVLWKNYDDVGLSYFTPIFSSDVNGDGVPDVLANHSALDGRTGELIWHTATGQICGVGDINNDGKDEIFTRAQFDYPADYSYLYCLNGADGTALWQLYLNCSLIFDIAVGNLTGDSKNEVIVPTGDWATHNYNNVYCLNGTTGNIIWKKSTNDDWSICAAIADVNNDGKNEALASQSNEGSGGGTYCLDGNGSTIWHIPYKCRTFCIGDLNQDPYKEIVLESSNESGLHGVRCISGKNGSTLWTWYENWYDNQSTSIQSMIIADMVPSIPGNEVIAGGGGVYCLRGGDNVPDNERELWHAPLESGWGPNIVMSAAVGDLDKDGHLDVAAITDQFPPFTFGYVYAIDGQSGTELWKYGTCGSENFHEIIAADLTGDGYPEVIAKDNSFVCALKSNSTPNDAPPYKPNIDGPASGKIGETYTYTATAIDPEGDNISYLFDWGDGTNSSWSQFVQSGTSINESHTWSKRGHYTIKAKAKDIYGAESDWSTLPVTMPTDLSDSQQQSNQPSSQQYQSNPQVNPSPNQQQISQQIITQLLQNLLMRHQVANR